MVTVASLKLMPLLLADMQAHHGLRRGLTGEQHPPVAQTGGAGVAGTTAAAAERELAWVVEQAAAAAAATATRPLRS